MKTEKSESCSQWWSLSCLTCPRLGFLNKPGEPNGRTVPTLSRNKSIEISCILLIFSFGFDVNQGLLTTCLAAGLPLAGAPLAKAVLEEQYFYKADDRGTKHQK